MNYKLYNLHKYNLHYVCYTLFNFLFTFFFCSHHETKPLTF